MVSIKGMQQNLFKYVGGEKLCKKCGEKLYYDENGFYCNNRKCGAYLVDVE